MSSTRPASQLSIIGLAAGGVAAVTYTAANICLRSVVHMDPVWVSAMKALPTFLMVVPLLGVRVLQGQALWTTRGAIVWLVLAGICAQIFGNVAFQWSLSVLGLAVSVPMLLGSMLVGGAIIGKLVLNEPVRPRTAAAVGILIVATIALVYGAHAGGGGGDWLPTELSAWQLVLAASSNITAGVAYAFLGAIMRKSMQQGMSLVSTLFVLSMVGMASMFGWAFVRVGVEGMLLTSRVDLSIMLAAGILNAIAFFSLAKSLQQIPVLFVQMLNATQAAMAALAGWLLFGEVLDGWVQLGLLLTAAGLILAGTRSKRGHSTFSVSSSCDRQLACHLHANRFHLRRTIRRSQFHHEGHEEHEAVPKAESNEILSVNLEKP